VDELDLDEIKKTYEHARNSWPPVTQVESYKAIGLLIKEVLRLRELVMTGVTFKHHMKIIDSVVALEEENAKLRASGDKWLHVSRLDIKDLQEENSKLREEVERLKEETNIGDGAYGP